MGLFGLLRVLERHADIRSGLFELLFDLVVLVFKHIYASRKSIRTISSLAKICLHFHHEVLLCLEDRKRFLVVDLLLLGFSSGFWSFLAHSKGIITG